MKTKIFVIFSTFLILISSLFIFKDSLIPNSMSNGSITLEWDMNLDQISGYRIYYGTESRKYNQPKGQGVNVGLTENPSAPKYKIENLQSGITYYFAITTYDKAGNESDFSSEVSKKVP